MLNRLCASHVLGLSGYALMLLLAACSSEGGGGETTAETMSDFSVAEPAHDASVTTTTRSEWSVGGVVTGRTERTTIAPAEPPAIVAVPPPEEVAPQPVAQSGLLTAGDHDDLLNPELYADYASRTLQRLGGNLPFVDTRTRVAVTVTGSDGRPAPFARVEVARPGQPLRLVTAADGTASYYPRFDRVPARTTVSVASTAGTVRKVVNVGRGGRRVAVALPGAAPGVSAMDVVLVIDATGSMGDEMRYLQAELDAVVARFRREAGNLDLRIGLIAYRDEGDEYVVRSSPLSRDLRATRAALAAQEADGGGDMPEAVDQAMLAAERMRWRPDAAKAVLLVADAPPHEEGMAPALGSAARLRSRGVQIVPVAASGVDDTAQYVMRTMAALTQGRYVFLTDDSGVGNSHAEPDVACYVVTRLDQLLARVLAGIAEGRRIEPAPGEVVRAVGSYDRGRCRGVQVASRRQ